MSKAALADLNSRLLGTSKDFRNKVINKEVHTVDTRATSIKQQIRDEIVASGNAELLTHVSDAEIGKAASKFRATLMGLASNSRFSGLRVLESDPTIIVSNTYGTLSAALAKASEAAIAHINTVLTKGGADYIPLLSPKLIHLDHTRTVAETRVAASIYEAGINPLTLVQELRRNKFITRKDLVDVYENILEISSYYQNDNKVFEIKGSTVSGVLKSGKVNEEEGRSGVNNRVTAFKKALEAAIKSNNWVEQAASDSYRAYVYKQLGNAIKAAGGKSTAAGKVNKTPAKTNSSIKVSERTTAKQYSPINLKSEKNRKSNRPLINLNAINAYVNSRLPVAIRANMGIAGRLRNRSGAFSESAKVVGAEVTPQGHPTLLYTYARSPYDVFDPVLGKTPWNTPARDPKPLIEKSIRDIARDLAIGRFYVRRV